MLVVVVVVAPCGVHGGAAGEELDSSEKERMVSAPYQTGCLAAHPCSEDQKLERDVKQRNATTSIKIRVAQDGREMEGVAIEGADHE